VSHASALNLATLTCAKYQNDVLPAAASHPTADPINTVMWLFGFAVAKSGSHFLYPEGLEPFGFALDAECRNNPAESMLDALAAARLDAKTPMDLANLGSAAFASRHVEMARTDPDSANTIMMWLFGFAVAKSGGHMFDADGLASFQSALLADCNKHPTTSLFDTLTGIKLTKPTK
jgi:hypothetical protein